MNPPTGASKEEFVLRAIKPASFGLALIYAVLGFGHWFVGSPQVRVPMTLIAGLSSLLFVVVLVLSHYRPIKAVLALPLAFVLSLVVVFNCLAHLYLQAFPGVTINLVIVILAVGFFIASRNWYFPLVVLSVVFWLLTMPASPVSEWIHYGFAVLIGVVAGSLIHIVNSRNLADLHQSLLDGSQSQIRLRESLSRAEEEISAR